MLTAKQIINSNLLRLDNTHGKPAQIGYDLSLKQVNLIKQSTVVLKDRTIPPQLEQVQLTERMIQGQRRVGWDLDIGCYDVVFHEGCDIDLNHTGLIRQRSSLYRSGALIASSVFDPGFQTDNIGTTLIVNQRIFIEQNARVAQIYFHEHDEAQPYAGQWQNDAQRGK